MEKPVNQRPPQAQFDERGYQDNIHRGPRYGKKKRSIVALVLNLIVFILVGFIGYNMYRESLLNVVVLNQPINFDGLTQLQDILSQFGNLNLDDLQDNFDLVILIFNVFFVACIISMVLSFITIIFNRTLLKIFNLLVIVVIFAIPFAFFFIVKDIANQLSNKLGQLYLNIPGNELLIPTQTIQNAYVLAACAFGLLFISLFFRNRRPKLKIK